MAFLRTETDDTARQIGATVASGRGDALVSGFARRKLGSAVAERLKAKPDTLNRRRQTIEQSLRQNRCSLVAMPHDRTC